MDVSATLPAVPTDRQDRPDVAASSITGYHGEGSVAVELERGLLDEAGERIMETPFPGMDPYLEHPALWPSVHTRLIVALANQLGPKIRPRYVASVEDRVFIESADQDRIPDVLVRETGQDTERRPSIPGRRSRRRSSWRSRNWRSASITSRSWTDTAISGS